MTLVAGQNIIVPFIIAQTELLAGTSFEIISPVDGFVSELGVVVQTAVTTGGAVTVKVGTTDVAGLSVAVADAATKGTAYSDKPTERAGSRKVSKGQRIQVVPAAEFATAGAINGYVTINTAI